MVYEHEEASDGGVMLESLGVLEFLSFSESRCSGY